MSGHFVRHLKPWHIPRQPDDPTFCKTIAEAAGVPIRWAFAALSDPSAAAELIKQLIKRAGVSLNSWDPSEDYIELFTLSDGSVEVLHEDPDGLRKTWTVNSTKAIARLLVLAPDAGPGPVLEALRGSTS